MAEPKVYYKCNPVKNYICAKTHCFMNGGPCKHTTDPDFTDDKEHVTLVLPADPELMKGVEGVH